jgi:two-component system, OmpR family, sensor kinase
MSSAGRAGRYWRSLRGLPDRTPLRVKMITAVLALVIIALAIVSFTSRAVFGDYLMHQAEVRLNSYYQQVDPEVTDVLTQAPGGHFSGYALLDVGSDRTWVLTLQGQQVQLNPHSLYQPGSSYQAGPPPQVPTNQAWLTANQGKAVTVAGPSGGDKWLVITQEIPDVPLRNYPTEQITSQTVILVVGTDLGDVSQFINVLTEVDLLVSAAVVIVLAIIGVAVVRASLRPLTDIEQTAAAIAEGDLSSRVPDRDPRTEVGRLGRSLNAMLSQIEAAFDARTRSEEAARRSEQRMRQFLADASHELRTPLTAIRGFAEYYRQRGGVGGLPGAPERQALANGGEPTSSGTGASRDVAAGAETGTAAQAAQTGTAAQAAQTGTAAQAAQTGTAAQAAAAGPAASALPAPARDPSVAADGKGPLSKSDLDRIMQRLEQESSRMGVLVEDMLLLARLDQQRPLEQRPVDMLTLAADAVHDARVVAPQRDISLTVGTGAALIVLGDEVRLRQVIGNLTSNAIHHTPNGTPIQVRVRSGWLDEWRTARAGAAVAVAALPAATAGQPVPAVVLEVADSGPGLTQAQAEHVFERFYRADQARTRKAGGAGLGLAIVAALVAAHGGTVWVESPPGGGATFRIAIPLAPEARYIAAEPGDGSEPDIIGSDGPLIRRPAGPARSPRSPRPPGPAAPGRHAATSPVGAHRLSARPPGSGE